MGFSFNESEAMYNLTKLRKAIDVSQHHDGITGTETTDVTNEWVICQLGFFSWILLDIYKVVFKTKPNTSYMMAMH